MFLQLRKYLRKHSFIRKIIAYYIAPSGLFDNYFRNFRPSPYWQNRIDEVLQSSDLKLIPTVDNAGQIVRGKQVMHNGLKVYIGSYYGPEFTKMFILSKGIHEPQEERIFMEVLKGLPPGALMIELGSFWSFYSMWFNKEIPGAVNIMVEPDSFNIGQGKRNFRLNKMKGEFIRSYVGRAYNEKENILSIDKLVQEKNIGFIHILHSDIQGYEYEMLMGAENTINENKIGYLFISTHSNEIHQNCLAFLEQKKYIIISSINLDETFSEDGLIVARHQQFKGIDLIPVSKKNK